MTSAPESGWVFKSEPVAAAAPVPPPPAVAAVPPPRAIPPEGGSHRSQEAAAAAAPAKAPVVLAPVIQSEGPLRFMWVPLAIGYSTILAMLPRRGTER